MSPKKARLTTGGLVQHAQENGGDYTARMTGFKIHARIAASDHWSNLIPINRSTFITDGPKL